MTGYNFALQLNAYLEKTGNRKVNIAKIASNPEKSKHLETATLKLFGQFVDFVNLRSEVYEDGSRIPSMVRLSLSLRG